MSNFVLSTMTIIIFIMLSLYVLIGSFMEHKKFVLGHETAIAILMGLSISLVAWMAGY